MKYTNYPFSIINYQFSIFNFQFSIMKKKSVWSIVLKAIVAVATALAGVFGISSCIGG